MQPLFLFKLLALPFFSFTTLAMLGVGSAVALALYQARTWLPGPPAVVEAVFWIGVPAVVGGRLVHVIYNLNYYLERPGEILQFGDGGLGFVGLCCGGLAGMCVWCRLRHYSIGAIADRAALPLCVLAACAWLGAFLHGSQYGSPVDNILAIELRDTFGVVEARWPTQLMAAIWCTCVALTLLWADRRPALRQWVILMFGYSLGAFVLDFTRGDPSLFVGGLRLTQVFYVAGCLTATISIGRSLIRA